MAKASIVRGVTSKRALVDDRAGMRGTAMASDLIVGPLDSDVQDRVRRICKRIGLRNWSPTIGPVGLYRRMIAHRAKPITERVIISVLNNASLDAFNTFSAGLEGLSGLDAIEKTAFRNLPWWLASFWLPVEFDPPKEPVSDQDGPIFVGSSIRLLNELVRIKEMSPLEVGTLPPTYSDMRNDYRRWFSTPYELSEDDTIKWVWNALRDGAQISIERQFPMMLAP
jgi:hypothetical protein